MQVLHSDILQRDLLIKIHNGHSNEVATLDFETATYKLHKMSFLRQNNVTNNHNT